MFQHFHRIVVVDPHVARSVCGQCVQQAADAGCVHFDADMVALRIARGGLTQRLAIAEADLQNALGVAPERGIQLARRAASFFGLEI